MTAPATMTLYDDIYADDGSALANATVTCVLDSAVQTFNGGLIAAKTQSALTNSAGHVSFTVIANDLLTPGGSAYIISVPSIGRTWQAAPQSANGSSQRSTAGNVLVSTPQTLAPAGSLSGLYAGPADLAVRSVTVLSSSPYTNLLADGVTATPAGVLWGKVWDYGGEAWNVSAAGAKLDGVTDDSAAWALAYAAASAAGGKIQQTGGTSVMGGLTVAAPNVELEFGAAAILKLKNGANADLLVIQASSVSVTGRGTLDGNVANNSGAIAAIRIRANGVAQTVRSVLVEKVTVQNTAQDGIDMAAPGNNSFLLDTKIRAVTVLTSAGSGIVASSTSSTTGLVDRTTIQDCVIDGTKQHGVNSTGASRTAVKGCQLLNVGNTKSAGFAHGIAFDGGAKGLASYDGGRITDNYILNPYDGCIEVADGAVQHVVAGNHCSGAGNGGAPASTTGIAVGGGNFLSQQCSITGNVVTGCKGHGLLFSGPDASHMSWGHSITGNVSQGNVNDGIQLGFLTLATVTGNTTLNNSFGNANNWSGIDINGATHCTVVGNICSDNQGSPTQSRGIVERSTSANNTIRDNDVAGNVTSPYLFLNAGNNGTRASGNMGYGIDQSASQALGYASPLTPDASLGQIIVIGALTGNLTLHVPTNVKASMYLTYIFTQDGTGSRTITWDAAQNFGWQPSAVINSVSSVTFFYDGTTWYQVGANVTGDQLGVNLQSSPGNPAGTASLTAVMMGLAASITPKSTGRLLIIISGTAFQSTTNDGSTVQIRYGTGAAPTNGVAVTGTAAGTSLALTMGSTVTKSGFTVQGIATGLTAGAAYWLDLALAAVTGGTATVASLSVTAVEF